MFAPSKDLSQIRHYNIPYTPPQGFGEPYNQCERQANMEPAPCITRKMHEPMVKRIYVCSFEIKFSFF